MATALGVNATQPTPAEAAALGFKPPPEPQSAPPTKPEHNYTDNNGEGKDNGNGNNRSPSPKGEAPKPTKIFDNKNYVEAPLPKTNPWGKAVKPNETEHPVKVIKASSAPNRIDAKASDFSDMSNWPTLNEVIEPPKQAVPNKTLAPTSQPSAPLSQNVEPEPAKSVDPAPPPSQTNERPQTDSGGDDSSKENKENSDGNKNEQSKNSKKRDKKPTWVKLDVEIPSKSERSGRKTKGREPPPHRRERRPENRTSKTPTSDGDANPFVEGKTKKKKVPTATLR